MTIDVVVNGGFEDGITGWLGMDHPDISITTEVTHSGTHCCKFDPDIDGSPTIWQTISVAPGDMRKLRAWVRKVPAYLEWGSVYTTIFNHATGTELLALTPVYLADGDTDWHLVNSGGTIITIPEGVTAVDIAFYHSYADLDYSGIGFYLDDVSFEVVLTGSIAATMPKSTAAISAKELLQAVGQVTSKATITAINAKEKLAGSSTMTTPQSILAASAKERFTGISAIVVPQSNPTATGKEVFRATSIELVGKAASLIAEAKERFMGNIAVQASGSSVTVHAKLVYRMVGALRSAATRLQARARRQPLGVTSATLVNNGASSVILSGNGLTSATVIGE